MGYDSYDDEEPTQLPPQPDDGGGYSPYPDDEAPTSLQYGGHQPPQPRRPGKGPYGPPQDRTRLPDYLRRDKQSPGGYAQGGGPFDDRTVLDVSEAPPTTEPLGYFFIKEPIQRFGRYFLIRGNVVVGRSPNHDLALNDPLVSDPHGRVKLEKHPETREPVFVLYDFGSTNGTYVNDERVVGAVILAENDEIRIGNHLFVFKALW